MRAPRLAVLMLALGGCVHVRLPEARVVSGQAQAGLTWDRAVQLALAHHPDLLKARENVTAAAHNRNQALGAYLPTAGGSMSRTSTYASSTTNSLSLDLDVSQPLFTGFGTTGEAMRAWREWDAARWAYREASAQVRRDLRAAFAELLRLYRRLEVDRRIAERRQENAELIRLRYEAGREHEGSWRRAQAIAEQTAFEARQTERRIDSQSLTLGRQLGGYFAVPMSIDGDLEKLVPQAPEPPRDYGAMADATPSVQRLTRTTEALKAAVLSSQSSLWPTAKGTFNYGASGTRSSSLDNDRTLGLTVSVPLFHGGRNVEGVLESNAQYRAAVETARSARDAGVADLSARWTAFRDAWEFVTVKRDFLDAARKRAEIVRAEYTTGLASFQDFDIAEQELADSERAYVQSLSDVLVREAEWVQVMGGTLEEARDAK